MGFVQDRSSSQEMLRIDKQERKFLASIFQYRLVVGVLELSQ